MQREKFAAFVARERKRKKLSKYAMAKALGKDWGTIHRWERGDNAPKDDALPYWVQRIESL